ncbi:N-formylglutamate amidohydrolase [Paracoccus aerius]|uniref:N-formylglutamate amidohydrolase n=1 Tax=Paracoccus aerius TaxID=1915382 RepID=A0ABS1S717_9RHOB|nr:N-formylglutamate amidohydrolase [Paracoccus aerius]MBL3674523.1 N-formylglutamate amidohydrolase [Paracoccus aerius]QIR83986.1 N-formylglutamate amidohydrolase [Paracoccus sp. AK26]
MTESDLPVLIDRPEFWASGVIFGSPHSGRIYPEWFLEGTRLPAETLRSSEDAFVDQLIACAPSFGAVTIRAQVPRAIVDLNRAPDEIDPLVVRGVPRHPLNQRTLAGLGVIPRVVSQGRTILERPIDRTEAERRIDAYWRPYHLALAALIAEARARFGQAILIDMHSMPHDALNHLHGQRPDMVLGNRHGLSASARVSDAIIAAVEAEGWRIRRNSPFAGAYICSAYGRPGHNVHVVQLEIDRSLYMDEKTITPNDRFADVASRIGRVIRTLAVLDAGGRAGPAVAAE